MTRHEHRLGALRIVALYAVFAGLYIYFSDTLVAAVTPSITVFARFSVIKGFVFIAVTASFLYVLIARAVLRTRIIASALAQSEARFRSYVESAPTAILVFDPEGRCVDANRASRILLEADDAVLRTMRLPDLLSPPVMEAALTDQGGLFERAGSGGRRAWVQARMVRMEGGRTLLFGQDVTERVLAEQKLRETNERLLQAEKMEAVGRLAGGVAHDFNNILTAIFGYSDFLLDSLPQDHEAGGLAREIRTAASRAAALTQQLLAFSRRQAFTPRTLDLNRLLRDLTPMLTRLIGEDVEVSLNLEAEPWAARTDRARLEQALTNLVINARDAMPRGGTLRLGTRNMRLDIGSSVEVADLEPGEYIAVSVSDTGHGMDAETRAHAFEPFFTTKEVGRGTGLGLATVYGIVKQSGGGIACTSEPGRGTVFTLYLPRTQGPADPPQTMDRPEDATRRGHETVLYAEDDEVVRSMVTLILRRSGYEVIAAADGEEALRLAEKTLDRVALAIVDVVMPRMDGWDTVKALRTRRPDLKCLYTSGYTNDTIAQHGVSRSGDVLLQKPIEAAQLLRTVREIIEGRGSTRETVSGGA